MPVDRLVGVRPAHQGEVKRLGDEPVVIELAAADAVILIAAHDKQRDLVVGPILDASPNRVASAGVADRSDRPRARQTEARLAAAAAPRPTGPDEGTNS
ncbi:MAG: hypothetical protein ACRDN8_16220 [Thermoleophilaceae bacterium]